MVTSEMPAVRRRQQGGWAKRFWRRIRGPLAESRAAANMLSWLLYSYFRLVYRSNRLLHYDDDRATAILAGRLPAIFTTWHGQHFIAPFFARDGHPDVAIVSRSRDAELNARVVHRMGYETVRGSGGRVREQAQKKGGVRALIALREYIKAGRSVFMMADIPHGTPREPGKGVIMLARISGAPIIPIAYASSRRHVFERSWDKAVLNLPFGRAAFCIGDLVEVPADADDDTLESKRLELRDTLNDITAKAYRIADGRA